MTQEEIYYSAKFDNAETRHKKLDEAKSTGLIAYDEAELWYRPVADGRMSRRIRRMLLLSPEGKFQLSLTINREEKYFCLILFSLGFDVHLHPGEFGVRLINDTDRAIRKHGSIPQVYTMLEIKWGKGGQDL